MIRQNSVNWALGIGLAIFMTLAPYVYYRINYTTFKRLRVVDEGKLYRSGSMTAEGFEFAIKKYGIKTIVNLQEEAMDPVLPARSYSLRREKESALCERLGVKYEFIFVDLQPPDESPEKEPEAIEKFLKVMDEPSNYPVLLHCRAGLHRTGVLVAMYRMQHCGWSAYEALTELRGHGFGRTASYAPNEYIRQYVLDFRPRGKGVPARLTSQSKPAE